MKHFGSVFEYEKERNDDLMKAYSAQIKSSEYINLPDVFSSLVNTPSRRFWVSEERASIVIARIIKGDKLTSMRPTKREMFFEIYSRVMQLKKTRPNLSISGLTMQVVSGPAPKFYLTEGSAKVIIYRIKKQWYKEKMQNS